MLISFSSQILLFFIIQFLSKCVGHKYHIPSPASHSITSLRLCLFKPSLSLSIAKSLSLCLSFSLLISLSLSLSLSLIVASPETPDHLNMYPPSSSSQPQKPAGQAPSGLTRYGSAPSALIATAVDSVISASAGLQGSPSPLLSGGGGLYFSGDSSSITSESNCKVNPSSESFRPLHRSHGLNEIAARIGSSSASSSSSPSPSSSASASSSLLRQRSSPAGFFSHLSATDKNGNAELFFFPPFFPVSVCEMTLLSLAAGGLTLTAYVAVAPIVIGLIELSGEA